MSKPFDVLLAALIDGHRQDWAAFFAALADLRPGPATALDTNISLPLQADRLFAIGDPAHAILHLELQSSGKLGMPERLLLYNVAAQRRYGLPVRSVVVLLRPEANARDLTGLLELSAGAGLPDIQFRYRVWRVWQESINTLFNAGLGLTPLALLTDEAIRDLPAALARLDGRLREPDVPGKVRENLLGDAFVLSGLRHEPQTIAEAYRRLSMILEDSTTYQWILKQGEERGEMRGELRMARDMVRQLATKRFGTPPFAIENSLAVLDDADRLTRIAGRLLEAADWSDLLATP